MFSPQKKLRIMLEYQTFPCCVLLTLSKRSLLLEIRAQTIYTPLSGEATNYSTNENPSTDKLNTFDNQLFFYQDKAGMTTPKSSLWFLVGRFEFGSIHETV